MSPSDARAGLTIEHRTADARGEFVLLDGHAVVGEMTWRWAEHPVDQARLMDILHTGVRETHTGQGWARKLVLAGVAFARQQGVTIVPHCSYARSVLTHDEAFADVLVPDWADLLEPA